MSQELSITDMPEELLRAPDANDPAFEAGYAFVNLADEHPDIFNGGCPLWYGWMVRQAFWEGVLWARTLDTNSDKGGI